MLLLLLLLSERHVESGSHALLDLGLERRLLALVQLLALLDLDLFGLELTVLGLELVLLSLQLLAQLCKLPGLLLELLIVLQSLLCHLMFELVDSRLGGRSCCWLVGIVAIIMVLVIGS